jgi:Mg-chelatase subunit ChlD
VARGDEQDNDVTVEDTEDIDELSGSLAPSGEEDKLMRSVMENDSQTIDDGHLLQDSVNAGLGAFTPDMLLEKMVKNFQEVKELYGETILREVTGETPSSLERNVRIPEFRKVLREQMMQRMQRLQDEGLVDKDFMITDKGFLLSAMVLIRDELDKLLAAGFGAHQHDEKRDERSDDITRHKRRYRDLDIRKTLASVARRGHTRIKGDDLQFREPTSEGKLSIVYCLDASGSMKGKKLGLAKRAGVALAYEAIQNGDDVGLVTFGATVETTLEPSKRFMDFVQALVTLRAKRETDIAQAIRSAVPLLSGRSKHIVLLTDALHTAGTKDDVIAAAYEARERRVTVSIIGIALDDEGRELSNNIADITDGRFFHVQNLQEIDMLILEDYARLKRS